MIERLAAKGDRQIIGVGEVEARLSTRRVFLGKVDLALGSFHGAPLADAALQGAQLLRAETLGVFLDQVVEKGRGLELASVVGPQPRQDALLPHAFEGILPSPPASLSPSLGRHGSVFPLASAAHAHVGLGRCLFLCLALHQFAPQ